MPRKDYEQFIKERLTALDPLRDTSAGGRADTEVIQPLLRYYGADLFRTDVRTFTLDTLRNVHPELNVIVDGVEDDVVAKPFATLAYGIVREIYLLRERQKPDPRIHTIDSAAAFLGALFVPVEEGSKSTGVGRAYYLAPIAEVIRPENTFYARNGSRFSPTNTQSISKEEMQLNYEDGRYYFDVHLTCTMPGEAGNIPAGTLDRAPSIARAISFTNKLRFTGGTDADTVSGLLSKARNYPTQLSFSVARGIKAVIDRELPGEARRIEVVGMGDPEMFRDIIRGGGFGPVPVHPVDGVQGAGSAGVYIPSLSTALASDILYEFNARFDDFMGPGVPDEHWWLIVHWNDPSSKTDRVREGRIVEVDAAGHWVRTESPIVPFISGSPKLVWEIRRKTVTLSDVPGGITTPTTVDGEVEIRDDEIHVGGCTDIYLAGAEDAETTDVDVASDEAELASGDHAYAGGGGGWFGGLPYGWIMLDFPDTELFSGITALGIKLDSLARPRGIIVTLYKGSSDISSLRCRQGHIGSLLSDWHHSDIICLMIGGNWVRYRLTMIEASLPTDPNPNAYILWVERDIVGAVPPTPVKIVRPMPDGIEAQKAMLAIRAAGGNEYYRVVDYGTGWLKSGDLDPDNYKFEVRVIAQDDKEPAAYPTGESWVLVDDVDIDLSDPKRLRDGGSDLRTVGGSSTVTTTGGTNFELAGVRKDDVLRILLGPDAGDHNIIADPSGPGKTVLTLQKALKGSGTFRYQVFAPQTPVTLPLIDIKSAAVLSDLIPGTSGSEIPYGAPLGATSSQFANAGTGVKWRRTNCNTGIVGRMPVTGTGFTYTPSPTDYLDLKVRSRSIGPMGKRLDSPGVGGPYNLDLAADAVRLINDLNAGLPFNYFVWLRPDNSIADPTTIIDMEPLYLAVTPYDSDETAGSLGGGVRLASVGTESTKFIDPGAANANVTSRTVMFPDLSSTLLVDRLGISAWNDIVLVETGYNADQFALILTFAHSFNNLWIYLFPYTRPFLPQRNVVARLGSPSTGLGRTFFRDPTLFEVGPATRYETGGLTFVPDPRMRAEIYPGYPDDEKPVGLYYAGATPFNLFILPDYAYKYGLRTWDIIIPDCRNMWWSWDFDAFAGDGPWIPPSGAGIYEFVFTFDGGQELTVRIDHDGVTGMTCSDLVTAFNAVLDPEGASPVAFEYNTPGGKQHLGIRTQDRILTLTGNGVPELEGVVGAPGWVMEPQTYATLGNLSYLGQKTVMLFLIMVAPDNLYSVWCAGVPLAPPYEMSADDGVQFKVGRYFTQRFSAKAISDKLHGSGLYYADVELIGAGAGNEWNLGPDEPFDVSGYDSLGYRVRPAVDVLSFSTREVPIMSITPWIQSPAVSDVQSSQERIYGAGLRLGYARSGLTSSVQQLADSEDERENNESALARVMRPCEIYAGINYSGGPTEDTVETEIEKLIGGLAEVLDLSEIVQLLMRLGAESVETPVEIGAAFMEQDRSFSLQMVKDRVTVSRLAAFSVGRLRIRRTG